MVKAKPKKKEDFPVHKIKIRVVGIGGGACSIVSDIASVNKYKGTTYIIADTDKLALSKFSRKKGMKIFSFGEELTRGMGTGMNVNLGKKVAEQNKEKIEKLLDNCDLCILIACLGGGTGSGATSVFIEQANKKGILTYGIFTLPFDFEREKKLKTAKATLKVLSPMFNAVSVVPNEGVFKIVDRKAPLKTALGAINKILGSSLGGLIEMIHNPGIINIDFADIRTIMTGKRSLSYLSRAYATGSDRAKKALQELLNNPLYPYNISKVNRVLYNICGPANLSLSEVAEISDGISEATEKGSKVVFGVESRSKNKGVDITLLAVGCEDIVGKKKPIKKKKLAEIKKTKKPIAEKPKSKKKPIKKKKPVRKKKTVKKEIEKKASKPRVRKSGVQVQKAMKEIEQELLNKEEVWETPAFLRAKK